MTVGGAADNLSTGHKTNARESLTITIVAVVAHNKILAGWYGHRTEAAHGHDSRLEHHRVIALAEALARKHC